MLRSLRPPERIVLGLAVLWLAVAAGLVRLEYFDGLDSILNARFFTGTGPRYCETRGPFVGAALIPAEWARHALGLHPLDLRCHHVVTALLHAAYLVGGYAVLRRVFRPGLAVLLAFLAAVPTFVFFSYAPFVSHDIFPGLFLVLMLLLTDDFARGSRRGAWVWLVVLGAAAMAVKPVFSLFWGAVIASEIALAGRRDNRQGLARRVALLCGGAAASVAVTTLATAAVVGTIFPETPFLLRGLRHFVYLTIEAHQRMVVEPIWVYVRNAPAYGPLAVLLVVPGLVASWRGTPLQRRFAVAWVALVVAFHLLSVRQVRYLAFLGLATAFVVVPAVESLLRRRWGVAAVVGTLVVSFLPVHPYGVAGEMARIGLPFYRENPARRFLAHLEDDGGRIARPVFVNEFLLSFVPERDTPFAGDLYHDVFHFGTHHLEGFYGLAPEEIISFAPERGEIPRRWPDGAAMILCTTGHMVNRTTWTRGPAVNRDALEQIALRSRAATLVREADGVARLEPGGDIAIRSAVVDGRDGLTLSGSTVAAIRRGTPFAKAECDGEDRWSDVLFSPSGDAFVPETTRRLHYFEPVFVQDNPATRATVAR